MYGTQWNVQKCMSWLISSILSADISIAKKRREVRLTNHIKIQLSTLKFLSPWRQMSLSIVVLVALEERAQYFCSVTKTSPIVCSLLLIASDCF